MTQPRNNKSTVIKLLLIALGMFGFGFALIPLYAVLCDITGLGGKTGGAYDYQPASVSVDKSRLIRVNFMTQTNDGMPWQFWSEQGGVRVHPGELKEVAFFVKNTTNRPMIGQAVPSVVPAAAAEHFHKTECFCFRSQTLQPGETLEMPMRFIVGPELPKQVQIISLSYSLFDITDLAMDTAKQSASGGE
jgi:cytochrome c oxidase assembly protein subunit 11